MKSGRQLRQDIVNELKWDPSFQYANIRIKVKDGLTILNGYVGSLLEKGRAETAVKRVSGVRALDSQLEVKLLPGTERADEEIAKSAENVVRWSNDLRNNSVKITVENGWITLTGFVTWAFQKQNIEFSLYSLMGVVGIRNLISIQSKARQQSIKTEIEKALKRQTENFPLQISISISGAEVTLAGFVHDWAERDSIEYVVWNTAGVMQVNNRLIISHDSKMRD